MVLGFSDDLTFVCPLGMDSFIPDAPKNAIGQNAIKNPKIILTLTIPISIMVVNVLFVLLLLKRPAHELRT